MRDDASAAEVPVENGRTGQALVDALRCSLPADIDFEFEPVREPVRLRPLDLAD
jgi:hypothetical protein